MNILYTITWPAADASEISRQFFEKLRDMVARGAQFPFDCPYEIALVRASKTPDATRPHADWAVAILAMSVTTPEIGESAETLLQLERWFNQCIPGGIPASGAARSHEASHLKLSSELRPDYDIVANFGTFVGEPELVKPETEKRPSALSSEAEAKKALAGTPLSPATGNALPAPSSPPIFPTAGLPPAAIAPVRRSVSPTASACLMIGLLAAGVLLVLVGLVLGAVMALGQFAGDPSASGSTPTSLSDFFFLLACCPLPILLLGIGLIVLGIFTPRLLKKMQLLPVSQPKG